MYMRDSLACSCAIIDPDVVTIGPVRLIDKFFRLVDQVEQVQLLVGGHIK